MRLFTGLVAAAGRLSGVRRSADGAWLSIETSLAGELAEGESVAVDGVCLTVTAAGESEFQAEAMNQTLLLTTLGGLDVGSAVNLELPLRAGERFGGHIVQGHVDGVGRVADVVDDGFARRLRVDVDGELSRYLVDHGSVAVNGVSLTIAGLDEQSFTVSLIPETLERTNLGALGPGATVNLEVDVLAKYVEKAVRAIVPGGGGAR